MSRSKDDFQTPPDPTKASPTLHQSAGMTGSLSTRHMTLGERLRAARYAAHLTQEELAGERFSKSYISAVERGKMTPSISALRLLAERLTVSLAYLLGEQDTDLNPQQERAGDPGAAAKSELPPDEQELLQRFDDTQKLLRRGDANAALERLGAQPAGELSLMHQARWDWLHGWALVQLRQGQGARVVMERGLEAARASHDLLSEGHLHFTLANSHVLGEPADVEQAFQEAVRCFAQVRDDYMLACAHEQYGDFLAQQGRYQEAYEQMRRAHTPSDRAEGDQ
jgi:transcriptional regulator with XRE-family HTH domain